MKLERILINNITDLQQLFITIKNHDGLIALDTETNGLNPFAFGERKADHIVGYSISLDGKTGYYLPIRHTAGDNAPLGGVHKVIKHVMANNPVAFHNAKFDLKMMHNEGIDIYHSDIHDTMIMSKVWDISERLHGLKHLSEKRLKYKMISFDDVVEEGNFGSLDPADGCDYASDDATITWLLYDHFINLEGWDYSERVYETERHAITAFVMMELTPFYIDAECLATTTKEMSAKLKVAKEVVKRFAPNLNVNSPKQLIAYLFEGDEPRFEYDENWGRTKTKNMKADKGVLKALQNDNPDDEFIVALFDVKVNGKLIGTYLKNITTNLYPEDYIHLGFNQMGAETGRSSAIGGTGVHDKGTKKIKPADGLGGVNVQNIPFRKLGDIFVPPKGYKLFMADYKSQELGLLANITKEPKFLDAFLAGIDGHTATASVVFNKPPEEIEKWQRAIGKTVNFALVFGSGAPTVADSINESLPKGMDWYSVADAQDVLDEFFDGCPILTDWLDARKAEVIDNNWMVYNVFGRIRQLANILNKRNFAIEQGWEWKCSKGDEAWAGRVAISQMIQGTAADLTKMALARIRDYALENSEEVQLVSVIHDSLELYIKDNDNINKHAETIAEIMMLRDIFEEMDWPYVIPTDWKLLDSFMED